MDSKLVFLDTETTGNNLLSDRLFQLCYKYDDTIENEYFKPEVEISIKSQSITHVTNEMVVDKPRFAESDMKGHIQKLADERIIVAHNAIFDVAMLSHEGVTIPRFICTLKLARALDPNNVIPEYNLQFLRYYLKLNITGGAHEAKDDVLVLEALFKRLFDKMLVTIPDPEQALLEMLKISTEPSLFSLFTFGKHRGRKIEEICISDRSYVMWLLEQKMQSPADEEDWIFTLKHHLKID